MRTGLAFLGVVIAVLAVAVSGASGISRPLTFSVLEVDESDASTNLGFDFQTFPKPGEQFGFKSGLYKWAGIKRGARIGYDKGLCTFTQASSDFTKLWGQCTAGFFLPGGQILASGFLQFKEGPLNTDIAVVGGTGIYANARGYVNVRDLGTGDLGRTNLTFHLLP